MEFKLLNDIVIIFALSIIILLIFHKLKLPTIIGFLITGVLTGPFGFGLVESVHQVEVLAEIGILLLLFTIGIEFSFKEMVQLKRSVLIGGSIQVFLTTIIVALLFNFYGGNFNEAIFIGFLAALSSTAILLKSYSEKGEMETPHGKILLSILIFQDIIVVPMILFTPILAGLSGNLITEVSILLLKALGVIILVFIGTKYVVPFLLHHVAKTRSRELFLFTILVICFGIVWVTGELGLSLALGAFLAGLIISESEYSHQALGHVMPFRDAFSSLFFVSIGMLLDIKFLLNNLPVALGLTLIVVIVKSVIGVTSIKILRIPWRISIIAGLALAQVGEFSFILAKTGMSFGFLNENFYQNFLSVSILTMSLTPVYLKISPLIGDIVAKIFNDKFHSSDSSGIHDYLEDHLIVVGFGINGRNLARAAVKANIPFIVLETNPDTVKEEREHGINIIFGDAVYPDILAQANIKKARIIVIAINDPTAVQRIVSQAKAANPNVFIIVRTRHVNEVETLQKLGADEVIPEEYETSIEIFARVLVKYLIPRNQIEKFIHEVRSADYQMFRSLSEDIAPMQNLKLQFPDLRLCNFVIEKESSLANKSLAELDLRNKYGFSIFAIKSGNEVIGNPHASTILREDDIVFVLSKVEDIATLTDIFSV
ncbi:MAG: cation:proton antiporter [Melioribacteraceae bacterium]|nr:MAG: cation:proton antiporter [Melioribacteraceae bacterium]